MIIYVYIYMYTRNEWIGAEKRIKRMIFLWKNKYI